MSTQTTTKTCANCAHWNEKVAASGECRRHAPQNLVFEVEDGIRFESRFPTTTASDWCGDFAAKASN
jgi:hypothetical protein